MRAGQRLWGALMMCVMLLAGCLATPPAPTTLPTEPSVATQPADPTPTSGPATVQPTAAPSPAEAVPAPTSAATAAGLVDAKLAAMSDEEKVGQLFLVFFQGPAVSPALAEMITRDHVGGIILFAGTGNIQNPKQLAGLIRDSQALAVQGDRVPLFVAIDQEGGPVSRLTGDFTVFPSNMAVGATGSADAARQMAAAMAAEMKAVGINMNFAPVMDVNDNPDNPVIGIRSFGASPELVGRLGTTMIVTYQAQGVLPTAKHFPGHGNTSVDSHVGLPLVGGTRPRLDAVELAPFHAAIRTNVAAIMTAHVVVPAVEPTPGLPATLSKHVLTGLLRDDLGFDGLIVTDSLGMGALTGYGAAEVASLAFLAGADVLTFGADPGRGPAEQQAAYNALLQKVRSGAVSRERLDASVRRILEAKARLGLLGGPPPENIAQLTQVGSAEHRAAALDVARKSITLVRDECGAVPIPGGRKVLVIWPGAAGDLGAAMLARHPDAAVMAVGTAPTTGEIDAAVKAGAGYDAVVVGTVNARQRAAQVRLVEALGAALDPCKLIVAGLGSPYDLLAFPQVRTYLVSYGSVQPSLDALADALTGRVTISGKLPVELPGLYSIGHGLARP